MVLAVASELRPVPCPDQGRKGTAMDTTELRDWARRNAALSRRMRLTECLIWDVIAERGQEWQPALSAGGRLAGRRMTPQQCFNNSQRTVMGLTAYDPAGCEYAEGFAHSAVTGQWVHHGWVVTPGGQALDRTWKVPARTYIGVIVPELGTDPNRPAGTCQLSDHTAQAAWAPGMTGEMVDRLLQPAEELNQANTKGTDSSNVDE